MELITVHFLLLSLKKNIAVIFQLTDRDHKPFSQIDQAMCKHPAFYLFCIFPTEEYKTDLPV